MNDRPGLGDFINELLRLTGERASQAMRNPAAALFLLVLGLMLLPSLSRTIMPLVVLLFLALMVWGMMHSKAAEGNSRQAEGERRKHRPVHERRAMHPVAIEAMQRAGQNPAALAVPPVDLGLLAYDSNGREPTTFREERLPDDAGYVRPFAVFRSPRRARGKIRFEMLDGGGVRRFIDVSEWTLNSGDTFVYAQSWLPVRNLQSLDGAWTLRLYGADTLLAEHEFRWRDPGGGELRAALTGDGEIKGDPLQEIRERRRRLSLDDLLEDQEGGLIESDPEIEAAAREMERLNRQRARRH